MRRGSAAFGKWLSGLILLLSVVALVSWLLARQAWAQLLAARAELTRAQEAVGRTQDFKSAAEAFAAAEVKFNAGAAALKPLAYLRALPWVSPNYKALTAGVRAAALATRAMAKALAAAEAVYAPLRTHNQVALGAIPKAQRQAVLAALAQAQPRIKDAQADLQAAQTALARVPQQGLVAPLREELNHLTSNLAVARAVLDDGIPLMEVAPALLGYPDPKTYLFILQNSDELRPTGGFIGTYGLLTLEAGHITAFATDDVYNLDRFSLPTARPFSPPPLRAYLHQPRFYLRDANWNPDFPQSAQTILKFYQDELQEACRVPTRPRIPNSCFRIPAQLDGVIAVAPEALRPLLKLAGPLTVSGQTFSADNLTDVLEYAVEVGFLEKGLPRPQRKELVSELGHALIAKIMALPTERWPEVLHQLRTALDEKQILLYSRAPDLETQLTLQGWGGKLEEAPGDYLAVFDANMFALKTDPYVTRTIFYQVSRTPLGPVGEVEIVYAYPRAGPAWKTKGYRSFTRVYVPKGSVLQSASGALKEEGVSEPGQVEITQESGKTVFGAFIAVQAGEVKRLRFVYRLPDYVATAIDAGAYELTIQKQPGTLGHSLTVSADFGKVPKLWSPTGLRVSREDTRLTWQASLQQDQTFHIEW